MGLRVDRSVSVAGTTLPQWQCRCRLSRALVFPRRRSATSVRRTFADSKDVTMEWDTVTYESNPELAGGNWQDVVADAREVEVHWREAQYHLGKAATGSAEAARLRAEMQQLRDEYARLIEEARKHGRELARTLTWSRGSDMSGPRDG
jgi:hypothetical protein